MGFSELGIGPMHKKELDFMLQKLCWCPHVRVYVRVRVRVRVRVLVRVCVRAHAHALCTCTCACTCTCTCTRMCTCACTRACTCKRTCVCIALTCTCTCVCACILGFCDIFKCIYVEDPWHRDNFDFKVLKMATNEYPEFKTRLMHLRDFMHPELEWECERFKLGNI